VPDVAPYGSWSSPLTAHALVEHAVGLAHPCADGDSIWWVEARPSEGGRLVVVRRDADGATHDVIPPPFSARTRVHEYGGLSYVVRDGVVWFANFVDQRVYRLAPGDDAPVPVTPEPTVASGMRFGDFSLSHDGAWILAVRETHHDAADVTVVNDVVAIPSAGGEPHVLVSGYDFFLAPRLSPDGTRLAWLAWNHPNMPWDGTELHVAELTADLTVRDDRLVAGGNDESVLQPCFAPDGRLHFASDRTGWWNLYVDDGSGGTPLVPTDADFAGPAWTLGQSDFVFLDDGTLVTTWHVPGAQRFGYLDARGVLTEVPLATPALASLAANGDDVLAVAGSPTADPAVVRIEVRSGLTRVLRRSRDQRLDPDDVAVPELVEFPTEGGVTAFAYLYRPTNSSFVGPDGERPPLVVVSHGGPTAAASPVLNLALQFWTTRGFAVVDVDYGGSSPGYGRAYRERLRGRHAAWSTAAAWWSAAGAPAASPRWRH
jgi:dipeptidyl aminopeptidase/acylaminoacyl peptidase